MNPSWEKPLRQRLICPDGHSRLALLGIGNELYGDDATGVMIARRLQATAKRVDVLVLDAGNVPENCTGALRRFAPDTVLLVDAALMNAEPGAIRCLSWQEVVGLEASTHTFPLHMLAKYLSDELNCAVWLVLIQPAQCDFDTPLSASVDAAVDSLVQFLTSFVA
ncbi:MAG: hydrogenase maturation peptidase HycI [Chloroflexi bacterium]|nr:hydrogenase maturation peptidase HycI [Chloroflexota bacterium]